MISTITTVLAEATRARSRVGTDSFDAKMNLGSRLNARCSVVRRKEECRYVSKIYNRYSRAKSNRGNSSSSVELSYYHLLPFYTFTASFVVFQRR